MSSVVFTGIALELESVALVAPATVRVRYTQAPLTANPAGAHDATNPANYTLTGPGTVVVLAVHPVSGDLQAVDLLLSGPPPGGIWLVTVANVQTAAGSSLMPPVALPFMAVGVGLPAPVNVGAQQDEAADVIRKHLHPALKGPGWNALIAGLAAGDQYNFDTAPKIFDQLFKISAGGVYLQRRAADDGLQKPKNLGMSDDTFRQYAIRLTNNKLTEEALLEVLEVFYGQDAVRANAQAGASEPYALSDGDDLQLLLDERTRATVVFVQQDAGVLGLARAIEVAAAVTGSLYAQGLTAYALPYTDPVTGGTFVRIYSGARGLASSVRITGGKAQNALAFPTALPIVSGLPSWTITVDAVRQVTRFTCGAGVDLSQLRVGDYVNVFGSVFLAANRGSFPVTAVAYTYPGGVLSQYFEVSLAGASQTVTQINANDILYFRPTKKVPASAVAGGAVVVADSGTTLQVVIPATSQAVGRGPGTGAYVPAAAAVAVTGATRAPGGTVTLTAPNHGLAAGSWFIADGVRGALGVPAVTAGNGTTTTSYSVASTWSDFTPAQVSRIWNVVVALADGRVLVAGGIVPGGASSAACDLYTVTGSTPHGLATQYTITRQADANLPDANRAFMAGCVIDDALAAGRVLVAGGTDGAGTYTAAATVYAPGGVGSTGTWTAAAAMGSARAGHVAVALADGRVLVAGGDNALTPLATATAYSWRTNAWAVVGAMTTARCQASAIRLASGKVLVAGGRTAYAALDHTTPASLGTLTNTAEVYDPGTDTWAATGPMTMARAGHSLHALPDGRVIAVGGIGYHPGQGAPAGAAYLASTEIYDPASGRWSPGPTPRAGRAFAAAAAVGTNLYVAGGSSTDTGTERLDLVALRWSRVAGALPQTVLKTHAVVAAGLVWTAYGLNGSSGVDLYALTPGSDDFWTGRLGGVRQVATVPDANTITYATSEAPGYTLAPAGGTLLPVRAPAGGVGPYTYDPGGGVAVTGKTSTLTQGVGKGLQVTQLAVADATQFPDADGWVAVGFGTSYQTGAIRYFGRLSATALAIDYGFVFGEAVPVGATVTLLAQKGPYAPANPKFPFYLTDSPAGRVGAEAALAAAVAAGNDVDVTVTYPGDRGLAGEGLPQEGAGRLSDVVTVYGGSN